MKCPKCTLEQPETNLECPRCGVVFGKLVTASRVPASAERQESSAGHRSPETVAPALHGPRISRAEASGLAAASGVATGLSGGLDMEQLGDVSEHEEDGAPETRRLDRSDWLVLVAGAAIAGLSFGIPFLRHTFSTLMILVHEMGHCIFNWLFGYPSVPAFDLVYGGGVALSFQRSSMILVVSYVFLAFLVSVYRKRISTVVFVATAGVIHAILAFTRAHQVVILFMGHGTELAIAGIFFYRALSGAAVVHSAERPLYAAIAIFMVLSNLSFAYGLMTSPLVRMAYEDAKGGGHWMDFSRIAEDYLHVSLAKVATFFFVCCFVPLVLGFLTFRYQEHLRGGITRLFVRA